MGLNCCLRFWWLCTRFGLFVCSLVFVVVFVMLLFVGLFWSWFWFVFCGVWVCCYLLLETDIVCCCLYCFGCLGVYWLEGLIVVGCICYFLCILLLAYLWVCDCLFAFGRVCLNCFDFGWWVWLLVAVCLGLLVFIWLRCFNAALVWVILRFNLGCLVVELYLILWCYFLVFVWVG